MDRLIKRTEGVAADHARMALSLASLTETSTDTYATDTNDVPLLNDGMVAMSKHLHTTQSLMEDESKAWDAGVLEDLKRQRDALVSVRDLFDRRERLDKDNIPHLERRIQSNETKLANLRAKPDGMVKQGEIEKVVESIIKVRIALFVTLQYIICHLPMYLSTYLPSFPPVPGTFEEQKQEKKKLTIHLQTNRTRNPS